MKLIFTQYLASLKERDGLDIIIPDLLSEAGFSVVSRPKIGTRQYGVDVAATTSGPDGVKTLFLISIKSGDLTRSGWDSGDQSLRASLNQIVDGYIPSRIPKSQRALPVVIVLCVGGDIHEGIMTEVKGYIDNHTKPDISFEIWNGDKLATLLFSGILREHALPETWRGDFRKSIALVDEPEASFKHFRSFVDGIAAQAKDTRPACLTAIRQIYLGLWTIFVWSRDAENTEGAYLCSEYALLVGWSLVRTKLTGRSKAVRQTRETISRLMELHHVIADDYVTAYIVPRSEVRYGLSVAVGSRFPLDINLRLFDLVGRIGMRGLWKISQCQRLEESEMLIKTIRNNPILCSPIKDDQAIDINIACYLLFKCGRIPAIREWIGEIARRVIYAFQVHGPYPCVHRDYRMLAYHPKMSDDYRKDATAGSLLIPTLAVWAAITRDTDVLRLLAEFSSGPYQHSALQLWYPDEDTEARLYRGDRWHGKPSIEVKIDRSSEEMLSPIEAECRATSSHFLSLSPLTWGCWPLVILACRHYRMPVPPHFWPLSWQSKMG